MDRLNLKAVERNVFGKKVKRLRAEGLIPAHVFGRNKVTEHITVSLRDFLKVYREAGETGLVNLKIGDDRVRPVMIRDVQFDPVKGDPLHVDFYQVNLKEKVTVYVPIELIGEEPELVHSGEAVILQTLNEVEVEALPTDVPEKIEVDVSKLQNIDDAITVGQLNYDREKVTINADPEEVVVKLAPAVTQEMQELLEEQAAETAAAAETVEEPGVGEVEKEEEAETHEEKEKDGSEA